MTMKGLRELKIRRDEQIRAKSAPKVEKDNEF
jgi:hypothetical protein